MQTTMKSILDQLMTGGKDLYGRGEDMAAERLGVGDDPAARGQMRNAALGGAAATAALGLLLGTRSGRAITRTGVLAGGVGLLGKLAYDAWRKNAAPGAAAQGAPVAELEGPQADARAHALLAAMVAAAKSDGHIDATERAMIEQRIDAMGRGARALMAAELDRPMDAAAIAAMADSDQARREIYALSALICGGEHAMERAWLDSLAAALGLDAALTAEIEAQIVRA